jgi:hypothetical protein
MLSRPLAIILLLLTPTLLAGQTGIAPAKERRAVADDELDAIILEAGKLDDKNAFVNINARAAMLVSFSDSARSESMFLAIWKFANGQTDERFRKDQAKLTILKYLYSRNPKLARQLLDEKPKGPDSSAASSPTRPEDALAGKLGGQLVDADPAAAAALLERSLAVSATPGNISVLSRLREKDPMLADYVAAKGLDALANQPSITALSGFFIMAAYVFPGPDAPVFSPEAEASLLQMQYRYFVIGRDVLMASLAETNDALMKDQHYSQANLQMRAAYQSQIAAILAALAPRMQPSLQTELNAIAQKLSAGVPANISQLTKFALTKLAGNPPTSDNPEENFVSSLSSGDFNEARKQLDLLNDEKKKDIYTQLLHKNEARSLLAKSDVMGAITVIRKIQDQTTRLVCLLDALKVARKKTDPDLLNIVIDEIRVLIPQTDRNGLHLRALFFLTAQLANLGRKDESLEFLNSAVVTINVLGKVTNEDEPRNMSEAAMHQLNDPINLIEDAEMDQAFAAAGLLDVEAGLALARNINLKLVQLVARLGTIQGIIKRRPSESKAPAKPKTLATPRR